MDKLSEKTAISIQLVIVIIGFAVWITRVSEKVDLLMEQRRELIERLLTVERKANANLNN